MVLMINNLLEKLKAKSLKIKEREKEFQKMREREDEIRRDVELSNDQRVQEVLSFK